MGTPRDLGTRDFIRFLAAWALVHETADEAWKAAVARGAAFAPGAPEQGPEAFVDGLAALVAEEKERLKVDLASAGDAGAAGMAAGERAGDLGERLGALAFELAELRGRVESLQASVDAVGDRVGAFADRVDALAAVAAGLEV